MTLGLDTALRGIDLLNAWRVKLQSFKPVPVNVLEGGPLFENSVGDGEIDLARFPAPLWHEMDGGRYLGTGYCVITRDPESGKVNQELKKKWKL